LAELERRKALKAEFATGLGRVSKACAANVQVVLEQLNQNLSGCTVLQLLAAGYPDLTSLSMVAANDKDNAVAAADEEGTRQTRGKRKRANNEVFTDALIGGGTAVKRSRISSAADAAAAGAMFTDGLEWFRGDKFRVVDKARGRMLIEAAAAAEQPLAVAYCLHQAWSSKWLRVCKRDLAVAFQTFLAEVDEHRPSTLSAEAQYCAAHCYNHGKGVEKDMTEAVGWYRKAAEQGHSAAQCSLGVCYGKGQGVGQDMTEAVGWYRKAAEQGHTAAQCSLGFCYKYGEGVGKDEAEVVVWFRKAAEQGDSTAQNELGVCYKKGRGVEKDEAGAVGWYRKAAEQGCSAAQCNLGTCYKYGKGVGKDEVGAVVWYRKAAEQGRSAAQCRLGVCYSKGQGVEKDMTEAVGWYRKAAEQGDSTAQRKLDTCYRILRLMESEEEEESETGSDRGED
jgi:TPR repeat protein